MAGRSSRRHDASPGWADEGREEEISGKKRRNRVSNRCKKRCEWNGNASQWGEAKGKRLGKD